MQADGLATAGEVRAALDRIVTSPAFVRSPRLAHFLRFGIERRLAGRTDSPKEYELGVQVFGRKEDYDPRLDPVVRVQARLLRFKLHEYYETAGKADSLRIDLPKGTYLPDVRVVHEAVAEPLPPRRPSHGWMLPAALLAVALTIFAWAIWNGGRSHVLAKAPPAKAVSANPATQELYLKGRYYWNKRTPQDLQRALDYFTQAIVSDPAYAKAYVGLADSYGLMREFGTLPDSEAWPRARAAASKAVELDDSSAEAHCSLGFALFYGSLDLKGGEREFKRAVELNPDYTQAHHWYANALTSLGRFPEAAAEIERARQLDPGSSAILADKGHLLFYEGQTEEAVKLLNQVAAAEPAFRSPHLYLSSIYFDESEGAKYLAEARKSAELAGDTVGLAICREAERGYRAGGWRGMLESLSRARLPDFLVAQAFARLGKKQEAIAHLQSSYEKREFYLVALKVAKPFDGLRGEPGYRQVAARLGL